jgi:hypothetical protein
MHRRVRAALVAVVAAGLLLHGNDARVPIAAVEQGTDMVTRVLRTAVK